MNANAFRLLLVTTLSFAWAHIPADEPGTEPKPPKWKIDAKQREMWREEEVRNLQDEADQLVKYRNLLTVELAMVEERNGVEDDIRNLRQDIAKETDEKEKKKLQRHLDAHLSILPAKRAQLAQMRRKRLETRLMSGFEGGMAALRFRILELQLQGKNKEAARVQQQLSSQRAYYHLFHAARQLEIADRKPLAKMLDKELSKLKKEVFPEPKKEDK